MVRPSACHLARVLGVDPIIGRTTELNDLQGRFHMTLRNTGTVGGCILRELFSPGFKLTLMTYAFSRLKTANFQPQRTCHLLPSP